MLIYLKSLPGLYIKEVALDSNYCSVSDAAQKLKLSQSSVRDMCKNGIIEGAIQNRKNGPWLIPKSSLEKFTQPSNLESELLDSKSKSNLIEVLRPFLSGEVYAALIVTILGAIGFLLINSGIVNEWIKNFNTVEIRIQANEISSGIAVLEGGKFTSFSDHRRDYLLGDFTTKRGEELLEFNSQLYLAFSLIDIPESAEIEELRIYLPCTSKGELSSFDELSTKQIDSGHGNADRSEIYRQYYYPGEIVDYRTQLADISDFCNEDGFIALFPSRQFRTGKMQQLVASADFVQFIVWFDSRNNDNMNGQTDSINITGQPILYVKYIK